MDKNYELIVAIVNHGFEEEVMSAAMRMITRKNWQLT